MRFQHCASILLIVSASAVAQTQLSQADQSAAFRAAGFRLHGREWRACDVPDGAQYTPGRLEAVRDLNGDGLVEAIVTEGSIACFGGDEVGFTLVSKQRDGSWKKLAGGSGVVTILDTKGVGGWPDLEIGGQGFCFPVQRWNGSSYEVQRHQYERKPCRPGG